MRTSEDSEKLERDIGPQMGRLTNPKREMRNLAKHFGELHSVGGLQIVGLNYVSVSTFHFPFVRLVAAATLFQNKYLLKECRCF